MKLISKIQRLVILAIFLVTGEAYASTTQDLFQAVPLGNPTYAKLQALEAADLIPAGSTKQTLTRYEVADLIIQAQQNYDAIEVADSDMSNNSGSASGHSTATSDNASSSSNNSDNYYPPPPPPSAAVMNSANNTAAVATPPPEAPTPQPTPNYALHPELLKKAEAALQSLDETYELELQAVMQSKGIMQGDLDQVESNQYQLWQDIKTITESPSITLHGIGRMFGVSQQIYGPFSITGQAVTVTHGGGGAVTTILPVTITNPETQYMNGYLDLNPSATVTKQIRWDAIIRLGTSGLPLTGMFQYNNAFNTPNNVNFDTINFRRISLHFSPDFMQMDLGDFYEAYTPFTIWNRNNLDLYYKPEPIARADDEAKYESFFNHEPDWPFRGIRAATALAWPDSNVLDQLKISGFVHMISNGFDDWPNGGWLFASNTNAVSSFNPGGDTNFFTDFIYAGNADLELRKWYLGELSVQLSAKVYEIVLDEIVNNTNPIDYMNYAGTPTGYSAAPVTEYIYNHNNPNTWAHQYRINSMEPEMKIGFGGDVYLGAQYEGSFSEYQDDKLDSARTISDFAVHANPYLQFDDSKITLDYLNVGPNYYSPLAQTRQDYMTPLDATEITAPTGLISGPLRGQYFLLDQRTFGGNTTTYIDVPRPNEVFSFYDRTQDAVFPYGLATPDREGFGFDLNIKSMPDHEFKLPGSVYFLNEIEPNYVVNPAGTSFTAVDALSNGKAPDRSFVYVNLGPSFDFGPSLQLTTPLELGMNFRFEQTTLNNLTGNYKPLVNFWWLTGVRAGLFSWWEVSAAAGIRTSVGTDMGYDGTTLARYSYIYDNQDLGDYSLFTVNDSMTDLLLSTTFNIDGHSKLHLDYCLESGVNNGTAASPTTASGIISGAALNGTINTQYTELTYEVQF